MKTFTSRFFTPVANPPISLEGIAQEDVSLAYNSYRSVYMEEVDMEEAEKNYNLSEKKYRDELLEGFFHYSDSVNQASSKINDIFNLLLELNELKQITLEYRDKSNTGISILKNHPVDYNYDELNTEIGLQRIRLNTIWLTDQLKNEFKTNEGSSRNQILTNSSFKGLVNFLSLENKEDLPKGLYETLATAIINKILAMQNAIKERITQNSKKILQDDNLILQDDNLSNLLYLSLIAIETNLDEQQTHNLLNFFLDPSAFDQENPSPFKGKTSDLKIICDEIESLDPSNPASVDYRKLKESPNYVEYHESFSRLLNEHFAFSFGESNLAYFSQIVENIFREDASRQTILIDRLLEAQTNSEVITEEGITEEGIKIISLSNLLKFRQTLETTDEDEKKRQQLDVFIVAKFNSEISRKPTVLFTLTDDQTFLLNFLKAVIHNKLDHDQIVVLSKLDFFSSEIYSITAGDLLAITRFTFNQRSSNLSTTDLDEAVNIDKNITNCIKNIYSGTEKSKELEEISQQVKPFLYLLLNRGSEEVNNNEEENNITALGAAACAVALSAVGGVLSSNTKPQEKTNENQQSKTKTQLIATKGDEKEVVPSQYKHPSSLSSLLKLGAVALTPITTFNGYSPNGNLIGGGITRNFIGGGITPYVSTTLSNGQSLTQITNPPPLLLPSPPFNNPYLSNSYLHDFKSSDLLITESIKALLHPLYSASQIDANRLHEQSAVETKKYSFDQFREIISGAAYDKTLTLQYGELDGFNPDDCPEINKFVIYKNSTSELTGTDSVVVLTRSGESSFSVHEFKELNSTQISTTSNTTQPASNSGWFSFIQTSANSAFSYLPNIWQPNSELGNKISKTFTTIDYSNATRSVVEGSGKGTMLTQAVVQYIKSGESSLSSCFVENEEVYYKQHESFLGSDKEKLSVANLTSEVNITSATESFEKVDYSHSEIPDSINSNLIKQSESSLAENLKDGDEEYPNLNLFKLGEFNNSKGSENIQAGSSINEELERQVGEINNLEVELLTENVNEQLAFDQAAASNALRQQYIIQSAISTYSEKISKLKSEPSLDLQFNSHFHNLTNEQKTALIKEFSDPDSDANYTTEKGRITAAHRIELKSTHIQSIIDGLTPGQVELLPSDSFESLKSDVAHLQSLEKELSDRELAKKITDLTLKWQVGKADEKLVQINYTITKITKELQTQLDEKERLIENEIKVLAAIKPEETTLTTVVDYISNLKIEETSKTRLREISADAISARIATMSLIEPEVEVICGFQEKLQSERQGNTDFVNYLRQNIAAELKPFLTQYSLAQFESFEASLNEKTELLYQARYNQAKNAAIAKTLSGDIIAQIKDDIALLESSLVGNALENYNTAIQNFIAATGVAETSKLDKKDTALEKAKKAFSEFSALSGGEQQRLITRFENIISTTDGSISEEKKTEILLSANNKLNIAKSDNAKLIQDFIDDLSESQRLLKTAEHQEQLDDLAIKLRDAEVETGINNLEAEALATNVKTRIDNYLAAIENSKKVRQGEIDKIAGSVGEIDEPAAIEDTTFDKVSKSHILFGKQIPEETLKKIIEQESLGLKSNSDYQKVVDLRQATHEEILSRIRSKKSSLPEPTAEEQSLFTDAMKTDFDNQESQFREHEISLTEKKSRITSAEEDVLSLTSRFHVRLLREDLSAVKSFIKNSAVKIKEGKNSLTSEINSILPIDVEKATFDAINGKFNSLQSEDLTTFLKEFIASEAKNLTNDESFKTEQESVRAEHYRKIAIKFKSTEIEELRNKLTLKDLLNGSDEFKSFKEEFTALKDLESEFSEKQLAAKLEEHKTDFLIKSTSENLTKIFTTIVAEEESSTTNDLSQKLNDILPMFTFTLSIAALLQNWYLSQSTNPNPNPKPSTTGAEKIIFIVNKNAEQDTTKSTKTYHTVNWNNNKKLLNVLKKVADCDFDELKEALNSEENRNHRLLKKFNLTSGDLAVLDAIDELHDTNRARDNFTAKNSDRKNLKEFMNLIPKNGRKDFFAFDKDNDVELRIIKPSNSPSNPTAAKLEKIIMVRKDR